MFLSVEDAAVILDLSVSKTYKIIKSLNEDLKSKNYMPIAGRYNDLKDNPCKKAGCIGKSKSGEMDFWTQEEFEQFLSAVEDKRQARIGFLLLFWTGMRIGELLALSYNDIDMNKKTISITKSYMEHCIVKGIKDSGVKRIRLHDLRHSHASMLIHMGVTPLEIAERLGHEKVETTLNTYSHLYPSTQSKLASLLDTQYEENRIEDDDEDDYMEG